MLYAATYYLRAKLQLSDLFVVFYGLESQTNMKNKIEYIVRVLLFGTKIVKHLYKLITKKKREKN